MNTDSREEFKNQLSRVDIKNHKIKSLIINNERFNNDLFNEYLNTEKVPSRRLYTQQFVSDNELQKSRLDEGSNDLDLRIRSRNIESLLMDKDREFYELVSKGAVNDSFYDHNINNSSTIKILENIDKEFTFLKKCTDNKYVTNHANEGEIMASTIFSLIEKLTSPLWIHEISNLLLEDDENEFIFITLWANHSVKDDTLYKLLKKHFNFHLRKLLSQHPKPKIPIYDKKSNHFGGIWLGLEEDFWRIIKTYANEYTEVIEGRTTWKTINSGISYLAGFTYECQKKEWIAKSNPAPTFKRAYKTIFDIDFDPKPFQSGKLQDIDPKYCTPFRGIPHIGAKPKQSLKSL